MQVMNAKHTTHVFDGSFSRGHVDAFWGRFHEHVKGLGDDAPRTADDEAADRHRDDRVGDGIAGGGHENPGGYHAEGGDGVAEHVQVGTADVQIAFRPAPEASR